MESDTQRMRAEKPYVFTNLKEEVGVQTVIDFICREGLLQAA